MVEIKKLVEHWVKTWNNYDANLVNTLFLDDERVTYFSSEKKHLIKGISNLIEHHKELGFIPGGKENKNKLWLEELEIQEYGLTVIVKGVWLFKKEESEKTQKGPVSMVYIDEGKGHRIAHAHFSNY